MHKFARFIPAAYMRFELIVEKAFKSNPNITSDIIEINNDSYFLFNVSNINIKSLEKYEDIKTKVAEKWKNKDSEHFLKFAKTKLREKKYFIANLDINFICEKPNINKYRKKMISKVSSILKIPEKIISIKATSNEKIGFIGDGLGIAAESIVQITNEKLY